MQDRESEKRSELAQAANVAGRIAAHIREAVGGVDVALAPGANEASRAAALQKARAHYTAALVAKLEHTHLKGAAQQALADLAADTPEALTAARGAFAVILRRLARIEYAPHVFVGMD